MFKRARNIQSKVSILFDGQPIAAEEGETVAAALFAAGILSFRQALRRRQSPWPLLYDRQLL